MPTRRQTRLVRLALVALAAAGAGALLLVVRASPPTDASYYPKCQSRQLLGLHCPGCGLTRSAYALLHGDFAQAVAYNPLAPVLLPLFAVGFGRSLWSWGTGRRPKPRAYRVPGRFARATPWLIAAGLVLFALLRNVPVWPLTLLAPHELGG